MAGKHLPIVMVSLTIVWMLLILSRYWWCYVHKIWRFGDWLVRFLNLNWFSLVGIGLNLGADCTTYSACFILGLFIFMIHFYMILIITYHDN